MHQMRQCLKKWGSCYKYFFSSQIRKRIVHYWSCYKYHKRENKTCSLHGIHTLFHLILQTRDDARQFMKYLHPDLGVGNEFNFHIWSSSAELCDWKNKNLIFTHLWAELPERSYGTDCRIYVPDHPKSRFNNVYVWLHSPTCFSFLFYLIYLKTPVLQSLGDASSYWFEYRFL